MAAPFIVEGDPVEGTDKHNVSGKATNPAAPPPTVEYMGVADYDYKGSMGDGLSDFVRVDGAPVALTSSGSRLDAGEDAPPAGGHAARNGSGFLPPAPAPIPDSLRIDDPIGTGTPNAGAGSSLVSVGRRRVLLDGDAIDTCDGLGVKANSTVTSSGQDFVRASE